MVDADPLQAAMAVTEDEDKHRRGPKADAPVIVYLNGRAQYGVQCKKFLNVLLAIHRLISTTRVETHNNSVYPATAYFRQTLQNVKC